MKFIEAAQGTPEWHAARCGKITASCFADAISLMTRNSGTRKVGDPTAAAERYAADIAIERISGKPYGEPPKAWVLERGHIMEAQARMKYEARTREYVTESGVCIDESDWFGYSTDGLCGTAGLIEVKAPIDSAKILTMWQSGDTSEYDHQMQGGMWLTGRMWCDFIMYVPDLAPVGKDLFVKRIHRDDVFIDSMVYQLSLFQRMSQRYETILRMPNGQDVQQRVDPVPAGPGPSWRDQFSKLG